MSFLIMVAVSIPVGLFCAHHAGGKVDRIVLIVNQVIMAIPPFFSGILITLLFGLVLHLFTPGGYVSYTTSVTGFLGYLIFPVGRDCAAESGDGDQAAAHIRTVWR